MTNRAVSVAGLQTLGAPTVARRRARGRRARLRRRSGSRRRTRPRRCRCSARSARSRRTSGSAPVCSRCSCARRRCTRWPPRRCSNSRATATSSSASASRRPRSPGQWHGAGYTDRPIAQVREFVTLLRECLSGETVTFEGDFYTVKRFRLGAAARRPASPKIVVAALNEQMLRLGGELADGVLLNYLPASLVPWCVERVREGGDAEVYAYVHCGVTDRDRYADLARKDLLNYAVVDAYANQFARGRLRRRRRSTSANRWEARDRDARARRDRRRLGRRDPDHGRRRPRARRGAGVRRPRRRRPDRVRAARGARTAARRSARTLQALA